MKDIIKGLKQLAKEQKIKLDAKIVTDDTIKVTYNKKMGLSL